MRTMRVWVVASVTAGLLTGTLALAKDTAADTTVSKIMRQSSTLELPATAARLVKEAPAASRERTVIAVVKAAVDASPAAATMIVGAVARATPEFAAQAAATAANQQPRQAAVIARAAAAAAPTQASKIAYAVCREVPSDYLLIAGQVNQMVPSASREIALSVSTAVPSTKATVDHALAIYGGSPAGAVVLLTQPSAVTMSGGGVAPTMGSTLTPRAPSQQPPVKTLNPGSTLIPQTESHPVLPGGRNYAQP